MWSGERERKRQTGYRNTARRFIKIGSHRRAPTLSVVQTLVQAFTRRVFQNLVYIEYQRGCLKGNGRMDTRRIYISWRTNDRTITLHCCCVWGERDPSPNQRTLVINVIIYKSISSSRLRYTSSSSNDDHLSYLMSDTFHPQREGWMRYGMGHASQRTRHTLHAPVLAAYHLHT